MSDGSEFRLELDAAVDDYLDQLAVESPVIVADIEDELDRIEQRIASGDAHYPVFRAPNGQLYSRVVTASHRRRFAIAWRAHHPQRVTFIGELAD